MYAYLVRKSNGDLELFAVEDNEILRVICDKEMSKIIRKTSDNPRKDISEAIANGYNLVSLDEFKAEMTELETKMQMPSGL